MTLKRGDWQKHLVVADNRFTRMGDQTEMDGTCFYCFSMFDSTVNDTSYRKLFVEILVKTMPFIHFARVVA